MQSHLNDDALVCYLEKLPHYSDSSCVEIFKAKACNSQVTKLGLCHLCVQHLAQGSFLPTNQMLQNGFLMSVTLRQHSVAKNWTSF